MGAATVRLDHTEYMAAGCFKSELRAVPHPVGLAGRGDNIQVVIRPDFQRSASL